jgi:hypothetical protein
MIKDASLLNEFEDAFIRSEPARSPEESRRIIQEMWDHGVSLGVLPPSDPWEGIDVDMRVAGILNSCLIKS